MSVQHSKPRVPQLHDDLAGSICRPKSRRRCKGHRLRLLRRPSSRSARQLGPRPRLKPRREGEGGGRSLRVAVPSRSARREQENKRRRAEGEQACGRCGIEKTAGARIWKGRGRCNQARTADPGGGS
eukprot:scaffold165142_cov26-Tisochrysis_lutea.AAC.2